MSDNDVSHREWASKVVPLEDAHYSRNPSVGEVRVLDVPTWILKNVVPRNIEQRLSFNILNRTNCATVMKVDAEGIDESILAAMVRNGALCAIDVIYTEGHVRPAIAVAYTTALVAAGCKTQIVFLDDETDLNYELP